MIATDSERSFLIQTDPTTVSGVIDNPDAASLRQHSDVNYSRQESDPEGGTNALSAEEEVRFGEAAPYGKNLNACHFLSTLMLTRFEPRSRYKPDHKDRWNAGLGVVWQLG